MDDKVPKAFRHDDQPQARDAQFRWLVQQIGDYAIFMLDEAGHIRTWNDGAAEISGYPAREVLGQHLAVLCSRASAKAGEPHRVLDKAAREGRHCTQGWWVTRDGAPYWADASINVLRGEDSRSFGFAVVMRDLTERKREEDTRHFLYDATVVLASALELRAALDEMATLVVPQIADWCLVDLVQEDGRIEQVAAAHVDSEKTQLARRLAREHPAQPELKRGVAHVIQTGRAEIFPEIADSSWLGELLGAEHPQILRELGARSYICTPLMARDRVFGAITLVRATEGARYTEKNLLDAEELGRRAGLLLDNARLYEQAQRAIGVRDEFLSIASHELRTPVTTLQLGVDGIQKLIDAPDYQGVNGRLRNMVETLGRQTSRLAYLVEGMLDVSRISSGRMQLKRREFDLAELVQEVAAARASEAQRSGSELQLRLRSVVGRWDPARIEQVVGNLLSNAFKYGAGKPVAVRVERRGPSAILSVRDHGIGIRPERLPNIFGRFERAVSSRAFGGLGLGLYMTRQIAEAHGGSARVKSEPGEGSTFTVELPIEPGPETGTEPLRTQEVPR